MTYQETLVYLYSRLPMFSRIGPAAFKKDLTNIQILCEALQHPQTRFKSIHIGGTNGKGSTSHMVAAILQTAGYKTGLYTSPHLRDFRERIKINGHLVSEEFVIAFTERIQPVVEKIEPSFFEITVAMAFDYFANEKVDLAVVEVGLGGRFDSTNIIHPELSVITNIGWDHMNMLGNSLEKIAFEKAGIIKKNTPVIIGETHQGTKTVFEKRAIKLDAPIVFADKIRYAADWKYNHHELTVEIAEVSNGERDTYHLDLPGFYQTKNLVSSLEIVHQLNIKGWKIAEEKIKTGLRHAKKLTGLNGRWEVIHTHPTIVTDVAHNEDGIRQVVAQIELTDHRELHIIIGLVKDKEAEKILRLLPMEAHYYYTKAHIPRALPETELAAIGKKCGLSGKSFPEVNTAIRYALNLAHEDDLILVCGSVFVIGEVERI
jgi:dihydrofolate synthase / folylpolyglutamate synthase